MRLAEAEAVPSMAYGERDLPPGAGELVLAGVTVRGRSADGTNGPVIDRLDLTVPGGFGLAVVGPAGSGKSTLAALAGRLADPDDGTVRLDGVPLPELSRESLRRAVGYAFERPAPLGESVRDTIGLGAPPERVEAAARAAAADGFIRKLPEGYDTPLDRAPLSGGETQRLGLARALARGGDSLRIIVLDDATAALDTVTEAQVSGAVEQAAAGRTRILIAHRPATAARADLVAWLDGGRLRALAPHRELWSDPEYRALLGSDSDGEHGDGEHDGDGGANLGDVGGEFDLFEGGRS
jgi:ATP-binding cassette subfamily B protein